jgi:TetR/AcrR family transcriptional regulator, fatty acid metabolism regulator protein
VAHRTWAFLRNEGEFQIDETADGITELICRGLLQHPPEELASGMMLRLERAVRTVEALAEKKAVKA